MLHLNSYYRFFFIIVSLNSSTEKLLKLSLGVDFKLLVLLLMYHDEGLKWPILLYTKFIYRLFIEIVFLVVLISFVKLQKINCVRN